MSNSKVDRPSSFRSLPEQVKDFLAGLPTAWDDTKYLGGEPGDFVILGRRKGDTWYIGGINGKKDEREVKFAVPGKDGELFSTLKNADGVDVHSWDISEGTAKVRTLSPNRKYAGNTELTALKN